VTKQTTLLGGIILILMLVVMMSGCTSSNNNSTNNQTSPTSEKLVTEYTIPDTQYPPSKKILLPDGTTKVRIEYQNVSSTSTTGESITIYLLNIVLKENEGPGNNATNILQLETIKATSNATNGELVLKGNGAKQLEIDTANTRGTLRIFAS
jgi:hypothetical protein